MRDNFSRHTLDSKNGNASLQIDVNCRNIEKEKEQKIRKASETFFEEIEKITGWN